MRRQNTGLFALALVGGYYLYRNRAEIQRFINDQGIDLKNINFRNFRNWLPNRQQVRDVVEGATDQVRGQVSDQQQAG